MRRVAPEGFLHPAPLTAHLLRVKKSPFAIVLAFAAFILVAHLLDSFFYQHFVLTNVYDKDWGRTLRVLGFLPLWLVVALIVGLQDQNWRRARLIALSVIASGIAGELLKLLFRRERPNAHDGHYVFRAFTERPFHSGGLALPSSHAVVAFGAAAMLARLFPRARYVFWAMAWGCGLSRVAARAHFFSDVVVAFTVSWTIAWLVERHFS